MFSFSETNFLEKPEAPPFVYETQSQQKVFRKSGFFLIEKVMLQKDPKRPFSWVRERYAV